MCVFGWNVLDYLLYDKFDTTSCNEALNDVDA